MAPVWKVTPLLEGTGYSSASTLLTDGTHRIIVDTSLSLFEGDLRAALGRHRLVPADIDIVINTHLHLDHCLNNAMFPRAAIYLSREEWRWESAFYDAVLHSRTPETAALEFYPELHSYRLETRTIRNVARLARLFWNADRVGSPDRFHWLETHALPDGLRLLRTPGHTPHHVSIDVVGTAIVAGDAVLAEDLGAAVKTMVPADRAQYLRTRAALLATGAVIYPGHGPMFQPRPEPASL